MSPTKQTARAIVVNQMDEPLVAVSVVHKYGNVFKNRGEWATIPPGEASSGMEVTYNTDDGTKDQNCWLVTWYSEDRTRLWYSDPNNFRGVIKTLENGVPELIEDLTTTIAKAKTRDSKTNNQQTPTGAKNQQIASQLDNGIREAITDLIVNDEATAGYWEHMLADSDAGQVTRIVISRKSIRFESPTASSDTPCHWRAISSDTSGETAAYAAAISAEPSGALAAYATAGIGRTKRTARVVVENKTQEPLVNVEVLHKYSKDYRNKGKWTAIEPGATSTEMQATYETGLGAIGLDWWMITWRDPARGRSCISNPNNFRSLVDMLETLTPKVIDWGAQGLAERATKGSEKEKLATDLAGGVGKAIADALFNTEVTQGFKEHMLTSLDDDRVTRIIVQEDGAITFASESGTSETVYAWQPLGAQPSAGGAAYATIGGEPSGGVAVPAAAGIGPTKRTARVVVKNDTTEPLVAVSLVHKYSNEYKDRQEWATILPGEMSSEMEVKYHTGFGTTGQDWWLLTWYSKNLATQYCSDPNNWRGLVDWLERISPSAIQWVAGSIAGVVAAETGPGAVVAAVVARQIAKATTDRLFNSETTAGFKNHTLREKDEDQLTVITVGQGNAVTFTSPSGKSATVYNSNQVALQSLREPDTPAAYTNIQLGTNQAAGLSKQYGLESAESYDMEGKTMEEGPSTEAELLATLSPEDLKKLETMVSSCRTLWLSPASTSETNDASNPDDSGPDGDNNTRVRRHEYAEHSFLGDSLRLLGLGQGNGSEHPAEKSALAKDEIILVLRGDNEIAELTYGEINALAGDFYGTDQPISDGSSPEECRRRFRAAWETLANNPEDQPRDVNKVRDLLRREVRRFEAYQQHGVISRGPYEDDPSFVDPNHPMTLGLSTANRRRGFPGYLGLSLINWDHFGDDARTAYIAGHAEALHYAATTKPKTAETLKYAYAMNAFADHFLEDLFSAGHLRTPRRALHSTGGLDPVLKDIWRFLSWGISKPIEKLDELIGSGLVDGLAKRMHDEECAIGLTVTAGGDQWQCYGDKRTLDVKNAQNIEKCRAALTLSAEEVFNAWLFGLEKPTEDFAALYKIPAPLEEQKQDLAPLFRTKPGGVPHKYDQLERRLHLGKRRQLEFTSNWTPLTTLFEISQSGLWDYPMTAD